MNLSQEENIILQSYLTVSLLTELTNNRFLESACFEKMDFGNPSLKPMLCQVGVDNQGCLLMALYAMLCISKETIFSKYKAEFDKINTEIAKRAESTHTTYVRDSNGKIDYVRHIRNAVAHVKVEFVGTSVQFTDEDRRSHENFVTQIPLCKVGTILMELQKLTYKYVDDIKSRI